MIIAHKITLNPNNKQATYFAKASGVARFAYNWALGQWKLQYDASKLDANLPKPSQFSLRKQLNAIKAVEFPWMSDVTKCSPQMAIIQLGDAFSRFFKGQNAYPTFKKKGIHDSFTLSNDQFRIEGSRLRIPNLGWVRMRESLRFTGKILSATVSRRADKWFVSITVDTEDKPKRAAENQGSIGVDLGVTTLATLSTGEKVANCKALDSSLEKLKRLSRQLSRKVKGSGNYRKAKLKLAKLHGKIADLRADTLHKLTSDLTSRFDTIAIEDLNVKGMVKNRCLARAISDVGFGEFRRQLVYKSVMRGNELVVINRWFPSSKTCSCCGHKLDSLPLSVREWTCPVCFSVHDRDINAAKNLIGLAITQLQTTASSAGSNACGEVSAGRVCKNPVKLTSVKQENNTKFSFG
jgi:putative transposase